MARGSRDVIPAAVLPLLRRTVFAAARSAGRSARALAHAHGFSERLLTYNPRKRGFRRDTLGRIALACRSKKLQTLAESDIYWDTITSITPAGHEMTYDLTVPDTHNFIANDIIVHNSHSAAYALIAYWTAYLKAHYPREYMGALLTSEVQNTDKVIRYINESREMGINILSPDVNDSYRDFRVVGEHIRFGLAAVKNVGDGAIEAIIDARQAGGRFTALFDFCQRVNLKTVNRRVVESLIKCGAFDAFGETRAQMMASLEEYLDAAQRRQRDQEDGQISMFDGMEDTLQLTPRPRGPALPEWEESQFLTYEKEVLGFYITGHPLARFARQLRLYTTANTQTLAEFRDGEKVSLGGMILKSRLQTTRKGDRMAFVTLEDVQGQVEVILFPEVYKEFGSTLETEQPVLIRGVVDWGDDGAKIIAERIMPLAQAAATLAPKVHISLATPGLTRETLAQLKSIVERAPGPSPLYLHLLFPDEREVVVLPEGRFQVTPSEELVSHIEALFGSEVVHFE